MTSSGSVTLYGRNSGASLTLDGEGPFLIGRAPECDVVFDDDLSVSRQQGRIVRSGGGWAYEQLSANVVTQVNGQPVSGRVQLGNGDEIRFSRQVVIFNPPGETPGTGGGGGGSGALVYGRDAGAGSILLDHPTVSRRHASVLRDDVGLAIRDLGSANGTFVDGKRIAGLPVYLRDGQRVDMGPFAFTASAGGLSPLSAVTGEDRLVATGLTYIVKDRTSGEPLTLLDNVSTSIKAGSFTVIVGESGSGKSTLMKQLAGRVKPQQGSIILNGLDLIAHFDAIKQDISYVPQDDILHAELTVEDALSYSARLRLPPDQTAGSVQAMVEQAARSVDLERRLKSRISSLSGGQKKRASLACELLTRPSVLFLDEVTSGLDEATDRDVMRLLRRLADEGMSIVIVTHTLANIETTADHLIVMARGGVPAYDGPVRDARAFFGIEKLGEVFDCLDEKGGDYWRTKAGGAKAAPAVAAAVDSGAVKPARRPWRPLEPVRQFFVLCERNLKLRLADQRGIILAAAQSLVIGGLLGYAFSQLGEGGEVVASQISMLMLLGMASLWLGCNASSQDIVGELTIFRRERNVSLSSGAFVFSKLVLTALFTLVQLATVFGLTFAFAESVPGDPLAQFAMMCLGGLVGVALGLMISSLCETRDQATTIVPLALIPQLILAGTLVPALPELGQTLSELGISAYWITEGMKANWVADSESAVRIVDAASGTLKELETEGVGDALIRLCAHAAVFVAVAWGASATQGRSG